MTWQIEFSDKARKQFDKLDYAVQDRIIRYLYKRVASVANPISLGSALVGEFAGHVRFRVGDYRVIARIEPNRLVVLVVGVGHRRLVYA